MGVPTMPRVLRQNNVNSVALGPGIVAGDDVAETVR